MADPSVFATTAVSNTAPLLIGTIITWFLSGCLLVQTYDYFYTDHLDEDYKFIKVAVLLCLAVDLVRSMAVTSGAWQSLVVAWGDPANFIGTAVFPVLTVPLTGVESCIVQFFFAWRIWTLKREYKVYQLISGTICLVALMQLGAAIARGVACAQSVAISSRQNLLNRSAELWLAGTLVCDSIIVATMTFLLVRAKLESSFKSTRRVLDRLIIVTLETAAVTLAATLVQLIFYLRSPPSSLQQLGIMYILGGLYSNVLLSVLNGRKRARRRLVEPSQTFSLSFAKRSIAAPSSSNSQEESSVAK